MHQHIFGWGLTVLELIDGCVTISSPLSVGPVGWDEPPDPYRVSSLSNTTAAVNTTTTHPTVPEQVHTITISKYNTTSAINITIVCTYGASKSTKTK